MSLLDLNLNEVPDPTVLDAGEYETQCVKCEMVDRKSGEGKMIHAILKPLNVTDAALIHDYMLLPTDEDDQTQRNNRLRRIRDFAKCFDCDPSAFNTDDAVGKTGFVLLKVEDSEEYGKSNRVKRFVFSA